MTSIAANLQAVRRRVDDAARAAGRPPGDVALLAVSKTWPASAVAEAADAGQRMFGENYVQEGVEKVVALRSRRLEWHFIGPLQSNKTRAVAEHFDWVHSVDRLKLAERLSAQRPATLAPLNLCVQVNISGEENKSGVAADALRPLADAVAKLPRVRLRGLMAIPEPARDESLLRARFATLRGLRDELNDAGFALDTLSIGMSDDLEAAIAEGATVVRVGTAIFGVRNAREERAREGRT